ncbi:MAG TPA: DHA2 family efflux MFS transporter permease subunit, partial [Chitinophagales bacterium]
MNFAKIIIILTVITAAIMEMIDTTIVNVALYQVSGSLGASVEDASWVITAYAIANVIVIPLTGFFQKFFGRKNYFVASIILFTVASFLCGNSTNLWELVFFRFIQGIGGGALLSVSQGILFDTFPIEQRPIASALFGMGIVMGPTLGPTIGGVIIDNVHWSWIFYVNVPIGIIATSLAVLFLEKSEAEKNIDRKSISIDYIGLILLAIGVGSLQYVLERGQEDDWFADRTIRYLFVTMLVGLVSFIIWELRQKQPIVDIRVMKNTNLSVSTLFTFVVGLGMFTSVYSYPLLVQRVSGWTTTMTGTSLIIGSMIAIFVMPFVGRAMSKGASPRIFVSLGVGSFILFTFMMSQQNAETPASTFMEIMLLRGFGMSMLMVPLTNQAVADLKPHEYPAGISMINMIRQIGGSVGIAIANTWVARRYALHRNDLIANINPDNTVYSDYIKSITQGMVAKGMDAFSASKAALQMTSMKISQQAYLLSYLDTFYLVGILFLFTIPFIFLLSNKGVSQEA